MDESPIKNGNYLRVTGYVTEDGIVLTIYSLEQITKGEHEESGGGARRRFADRGSTKELGELLATDPEFEGGTRELNFLHLRPARVETRFDACDTEYAEGKLGYRFERPATADELAQIM
ncbi:hypothetical protein J4447_01720 [Candidatus Pacearchaeota archaeon]|nr:hypothetical protein [Candidatus Pacearchaeota archaeon]